MTEQMGDAAYRRELGNGLRLRWSTAADGEGLLALYSHVFRDKADDPVDPMTVAWQSDVLSGAHPQIGPDDYALVEEIDGGRIVAATCLMRQEIEYAGIPVPLGRPEVVASHPDYRRQGLIRRVFELIHARSAQRGDLMLGITGIEYFYRLFGYEYALEIGGGLRLPFGAVPALDSEATEPYALREATPDDLPVIMPLYDQERSTAAISTPVPVAYWRWVIAGQNPASGEGWWTFMIVDAAGRAVGYVTTRRTPRDGALPITGLTVQAGTSLLSVLPSVMRALRDRGPALMIGANPKPLHTLYFVTGRREHPVTTLLSERTALRLPPPYAWYVRVPDLPAFMRHIAPALERRLADSAAAGWSGDLRLSFYRGGLRLRFEAGQLTAAEDWQDEVWGEPAHAGFPPLVFLQLLFHYRSLAQLRASFSDVWAEDEPTLLLDALFPSQPTWVLPLD